MVNLYQITVRKSKFQSAQAYKDRFKAAFEDILNLAKLLCQSNDSVVQEYLHTRHLESLCWLSFTEDQVTICVKPKFVQINRNDGDDDTKEIVYDFYKRFPADDYFILAVIAILKHHLPGSVLGKEVMRGVSDEEFNDGVCLAALVNPKVCNPREGNIVKGAPRGEQLREVMECLVNKVEKKKTVIRRFIGGTHVKVLADPEPIQKVPKLDTADPQEAEEDYHHKSESPGLF